MIKSDTLAPSALFLVERGWRGMRELAIALTRQHISCELVIKGRVPQDVLDIISPRTGIAVSAIGRFSFRPAMIGKIFKQRFFGGLRCVIVNKERTLWWISILNRLIGVTTVLLTEKGESFALADYQERTLTPEELAATIVGEIRP